MVQVMHECMVSFLMELYLMAYLAEYQCVIQNSHCLLTWFLLSEQSLLLEKSIYDIKMLEMMDNMIEPYGMRRLARALPNSPSILTLSLDYNEYVVNVL